MTYEKYNRAAHLEQTINMLEMAVDCCFSDRVLKTGEISRLLKAYGALSTKEQRRMSNAILGIFESELKSARKQFEEL